MKITKKILIGLLLLSQVMVAGPKKEINWNPTQHFKVPYEQHNPERMSMFSSVDASKTTLPEKVLAYQPKSLEAKSYDQFDSTPEESENAFRMAAALATQSAVDANLSVNSENNKKETSGFEPSVWMYLLAVNPLDSFYLKLEKAQDNNKNN